MPTGYTNGILNGEIKTFDEFAKQCIRAFGAAIHMRDDDFNKEYEKIKPDNYYINSLNTAKEKLEKIKKASDNDIIKKHTKELKAYRKTYIEKIKVIKKDKELLESFLNKAENFTPPTSEHENFKKFMIQQLQETIKYDCNSYYYEQELHDVNERLNNINANDIRDNLVKRYEKDILYYTEGYEKEVENCNTSNEWVDTLLNSLNSTK